MHTGTVDRQHRQSFWERLRRGTLVRMNLENVLGTSLELHVTAANDDVARRAQSALLDEVDRLADILDQRSVASEVTAWQRTLNCDATVSPELAAVLAAANRWREITRDAFHPAAISLPEASSDTADSAMLLEELRRPLWEVDENRGVARRLSTRPFSLDGIAKGYIVSRAASRVYDVPGVSQVLLNIGGDVEHAGSRPVVVGVADPSTGADNGDLLARVALRDEALATSGGYRRGRHIIDPRTGAPPHRAASASVIAPDCATADALSTAFCVLDPAESLAIAESLSGVGCLIVDVDGRTITNAEWNSHVPLARR
jgi:thiamine biosynthesis lipoprotein